MWRMDSLSVGISSSAIGQKTKRPGLQTVGGERLALPDHDRWK